MSATFYDLQKFAKTGVASAGMTNFDKLRALATFGGRLMTIMGVPPLQFFGYGEPLISYQIYGNMTQNGTPTPSDPIFPQECGDKTSELWNPSETSVNRLFKIKADTAYVAGKLQPLGSNKGNVNVTLYDSDMNQLWSDYAFVWIGLTTPNSMNATYVQVKLIGYESYTRVPQECVSFREAGTVREPYGYKIPITCGGVTQNIYLDEPLRKIGNYADEVKSDGTAVRKIKKIVLDGTENWQTLWGVLYCNLSTAADTTWKVTTVMCDRYNAKGNLSQAQGYPSHYGDCSITFRDYNSSLMIRDDRYGTDTAAYKSYLADQYAAGTPVTIWYVLAEDQVEAVTLPQIPTISGQNTLSFGTALQPSSVSVTGHIKHVTS